MSYQGERVLYAIANGVAVTISLVHFCLTFSLMLVIFRGTLGWHLYHSKSPEIFQQEKHAQYEIMFNTFVTFAYVHAWYGFLQNKNQIMYKCTSGIYWIPAIIFLWKFIYLDTNIMNRNGFNKWSTCL